MYPFALPRRTPGAARPVTLDDCRREASLLLKALRGPDPQRARRAADRLRALPDFAPLDADRIVAWRDDVRRKHALAAIALEHGYGSWCALKSRLDPAIPVLVPTRLFGRITGGFLNRWYRDYAEARTGQAQRPGILFPHRQHFVVCDPPFLTALGLDAGDPDWVRIGWDWVQPRDAAAYRRLAWKLEARGLAVAASTRAEREPAVPTRPAMTQPADDGDEDLDAVTTLAVGRVTVLVHDYDKALHFYRDLVGLTVLNDETTQDGQRLLHVGSRTRDGDTAGLWLLKPEPQDADLVGRQAGRQPLLVLYTDDCAASYAALAARGVEFVKAPGVLGSAIFAAFRDLYGNKVVLAQVG